MSSKVWIRHGWVCIPYESYSMARVEIAVADPTKWLPAYLDFDGDDRVAKVRVPDVKDSTGVGVRVWYRVNEGSATPVGKVTIPA